MKLLHRIILLLLIVFSYSNAFGGLVTVEPDDYEHGTNITSSTSGVWLRAISQNVDSHSTAEGIYVGDVYATQGSPCYAGDACDQPYVAGTGENVFGWRSLNGNFSQSWNGAYQYSNMEDFPDWAPNASFMGMMVSFENPTSYVELLGMTFTDATAMIAYDIAGNRLEITSEVGSGMNYCCAFEPGLTHYSKYNISISREFNDIAHIVVGGEYASTYLDRLRYATSVPEPATVLILSSGLLVLGVRRKLKPFPK